MNGYILSVEKVIPASPEVIFGFLADATNHPVIDGSGMLTGAKSGSPDRLSLGVAFGMSMKLGVRYSTVNRVTAFEENRHIAWKTGPESWWGNVLGGRTWSYDLEPITGGTVVCESWDITDDHQRQLLKLGDIYSGKVRRDMERTLERLERAVAVDEARGG